MINETIRKIEERLRQAESIKGENKAELLTLLATLRAEVSELARTDADRARSIAGLTAASTDQVTRKSRNPESIHLSLTELASSVDGFEQSHPKLVQAVNSICTTLSNLGI